MNERRRKALYEDVLSTIEKASALEHEGKQDEANAMIADMKTWLEAMLEESVRSTPPKVKIEINRSMLPEAGMVLAADDTVTLKMVSVEEHDHYLEVISECNVTKEMNVDDEFRETLWGDFLKEYSIVASIYDKSTQAFVGYCSVKDMRTTDWEIAIEEKARYRNQGYGYAALRLFINRLTELTGNRFYRARIDIDNIPSQKLWKKLGGYPDGVSEFLLHGDELAEFQRENAKYINDDIRKVADEFCMDPEDILGYVLEYRLDTKTTRV